MFLLRSYILLAAFVPAVLFGITEESIRVFESSIKIQPHGTLLIRERIIAQVLGKKIKHGLQRTFQHVYRYGPLGLFRFTVPIRMQNAWLDKQVVMFHKAYSAQSITFYFGNSQKLLSHGPHELVIEYELGKVIGFFDDRNELFHDIAGHEWELPIYRLQSRIQLPQELLRTHNMHDLIASEDVQLRVFTGQLGEDKQVHETTYDPEGDIQITTTEVLQPNEGILVALSWPSGFVEKPSWIYRCWWFVLDNWLPLWSFIGLIVLVLYAIFVAYTLYRNQRNGQAVIPQFSPPVDLSPVGIRYLLFGSCDAKGLAAYIVNMAVGGFLRIEYTKRLFFRGTYILHRNNKEHFHREPSAEENEVLALLFPARAASAGARQKNNKNSTVDSIQLEPTTLARVKRLLWSNAGRSLGGMRSFDYYDKYYNFFGLVGGVWAFGLVMALRSAGNFIDCVLPIISFVLALLLYSLARKFFITYTPEGAKLKAEILGFKMFLETTEVERLALVGTPPTKTPEQYEQFLPYAMALGVEKQWSAQFAPIFEKRVHQDITHVPFWYIGRQGRTGAFSPFYFSSSLSTRFVSVIRTASKTPPGSQSIFGGKGGGGGGSGGSRGGGGYSGGGGGGGW